MGIRSDTIRSKYKDSDLEKIRNLEILCRQYEKHRALYESEAFVSWVNDELEARKKKHEYDRLCIDLTKEGGHEGDLQIQAKQREIIDMINLPDRRKREAEIAEADLIKMKKES